MRVQSGLGRLFSALAIAGVIGACSVAGDSAESSDGGGSVGAGSGLDPDPGSESGSSTKLPTVDEEGGSDTSQSAGSPAVPSRSDWVVFDLLELVPATEQNLQFMMVTDYDRATEANGLQRPDGTDRDAVLEWARELGPGDDRAAFSYVGYRPTNKLIELDAWRREVGFSVAETGAAVFAGAEPTHLRVYSVSVDPQDIDRAIRSDPTWGPELEDQDGPGGPFYYWSGDAYQEPGRNSPARPLGRGGLLAVRDGLVIRSPFEESFIQALEGHATGGSVAENADVVGLVAAMDRVGVYDLLISDRVLFAEPPFTAGVEQRALYVEALERGDFGPGMIPYRMLAAGVTRDGAQPLEVIAFAHASPADAAENVERLRATIEMGMSALNGDLSWSETYRVRSVESQGNVSIVVLELQPDSYGGVYLSFYDRDSLYWTQAEED